MAWLLSLSAFFCADNGFPGSLAKQVPQSQRQVGEVPRGRHGAKLKMGRTFAHPVCWRRRVRGGMEGACLSSVGQFLPLGEARRFLVLLSGRLGAGMAGASNEELALI